MSAGVHITLLRAARTELTARKPRRGRRKAGLNSDDPHSAGSVPKPWELPSVAAKGLLDTYLLHAQESGERAHLGGDALGRACSVRGDYIQRVRDRLAAEGWITVYGIARWNRKTRDWERRTGLAWKTLPRGRGWVAMVAVDVEKVQAAIEAHRDWRAQGQAFENTALGKAAQSAHRAADKGRTQSRARRERPAMPKAGAAAGRALESALGAVAAVSNTHARQSAFALRVRREKAGRGAAVNLSESRTEFAETPDSWIRGKSPERAHTEQTGPVTGPVEEALRRAVSPPSVPGVDLAEQRDRLESALGKLGAGLGGGRGTGGEGDGEAVANFSAAERRAG
jgi:hypothetical protein